MSFFTELEDSILDCNLRSKQVELLQLVDEKRKVQRNILRPLHATNTNNSTNFMENDFNPIKDQYSFPGRNNCILKENIPPAPKPNEKQPDFSLYSKYLRPSYNTIKKKKIIEEPAPKIPSVDVVNIKSLGIGPEIKSDFDKLLDKLGKCFKLFRMLKSEILMIELSVFKCKITQVLEISPKPTNIQKQYNLLSQIAIEEYMKLEIFLPKFEKFLLTKNVEFKTGSDVILKEFLSSVQSFQELELFNQNGTLNVNFPDIFFVIEDLALSIKYATSDVWMLKEMFFKMEEKPKIERNIFIGSSHIL